MNICLSNVTGRYHSFDGDNKSINFILNDGLLEKFHEIFSDTKTKLGIGINDFTFDNDYGPSFKTKVSNDRTCFQQNNDRINNIPPRQSTNYNCRMLVRIESVFFNNKDNKDDIICYPQVFLEECRVFFLIILKDQIMSQIQTLNLKKSLTKIL